MLNLTTISKIFLELINNTICHTHNKYFMNEDLNWQGSESTKEFFVPTPESALVMSDVWARTVVMAPAPSIVSSP